MFPNTPHATGSRPSSPTTSPTTNATGANGSRPVAIVHPTFSREDNSLSADQMAQRAADTANPAMLKRALERGADINAIIPGRPGNSLLMHAIVRGPAVGQEAFVRALLSSKDNNGRTVDITHRNAAGENALHLMARVPMFGSITTFLTPQALAVNRHLPEEIVSALNTRTPEDQQTPLDIVHEAFQQDNSWFPELCTMSALRLLTGQLVRAPHDGPDLALALEVIRYRFRGNPPQNALMGSAIAAWQAVRGSPKGMVYFPPRPPGPTH